MVGWYHRPDGHEFEQTLGDGEGQGGLVCCSPWGRKESDTTERPNSNKNKQADEKDVDWPPTGSEVGVKFSSAVPCVAWGSDPPFLGLSVLI